MGRIRAAMGISIGTIVLATQLACPMASAPKERKEGNNHRPGSPPAAIQTQPPRAYPPNEHPIYGENGTQNQRYEADKGVFYVNPPK